MAHNIVTSYKKKLPTPAFMYLHVISFTDVRHAILRCHSLKSHTKQSRVSLSLFASFNHKINKSDSRN